MGSLQALASFTAFITSFLFAKWIDRLPIRKFLVAIIFFGVAAILSHLFYFHPWVVSHSAVAKGAAIVTRIPFAALDTVVFLMLANLAAKASPAQSGGSAFALFMSFYNLGQLGSSILGGILISHVSLPWLVVISAFFSLFALLILPFLDISEPLTSLEKRIRKVIAK